METVRKLISAAADLVAPIQQCLASLDHHTSSKLCEESQTTKHVSKHCTVTVTSKPKLFNETIFRNRENYLIKPKFSHRNEIYCIELITTFSTREIKLPISIHISMRRANRRLGFARCELLTARCLSVWSIDHNSVVFVHSLRMECRSIGLIEIQVVLCSCDRLKLNLAV